MFSNEKSQVAVADESTHSLRLLEHLRAPRIAGVGVLLVAVDGVLEHREHQQPLALETARAPERREELGR